MLFAACLLTLLASGVGNASVLSYGDFSGSDSNSELNYLASLSEAVDSASSGSADDQESDPGEGIENRERVPLLPGNLASPPSSSTGAGVIAVIDRNEFTIVEYPPYPEPFYVNETLFWPKPVVIELLRVPIS